MTDLPKPTLLLAEDDNALRDLLVLALSQAGWQVVCASDGAAALEQARRCQPQVMLLDILLPKISGLDVLRLLKKQAGFEQLPIIVMSELAFRETVEQAIGAGAQAFIVKPFDVQLLVNKVQAARQQPIRAVKPELSPGPPTTPAYPFRPPTYRKVVANLRPEE